jgi:hypothetical protein
MQDTIICAQCGSANPRTHKFCGECGAALAAGSTIDTGLPAQTTTAAEISDDQLPAWLREPTAGATDTQHAGVPEWLHETSAPTPGVADSDLPDWLREATQPAPTGQAWPQPSAAEAQLPDWLQETDQPGTETPQEAESQGEPALPPWLADLGISDSEIPPAESPAPSGLPAWLTHGEAEGQASEDRTEEPALLDWSSEIGGVEATSAGGPETDQGSSGLPAWLVSETEASNVPFDAGLNTPDEEDALPAWLRDEQLHPEGTQPPEGDDLLPSWLQEEPAGASAPVSEEPADAGAGAADEQAVEGLPAWLSGLDASTESTVEGTSAHVGYPGAAPDWLIESDQPPTGAQAAGAEPASGLPAWLQAETEDVDTFAPPSASERMAVETEAKGAAELPDWLRPSEDEQIAEADELEGELPDWLTSESTPQVEETPSADGGLVPHGQTGDEEVPAWLRDVTAGADGATADTESWLSPSAEDSPDQKSQAVEQPFTPAAGEGDLPPWLQEIDSQGDAPPAGIPAEPVPAVDTTDELYTARIYPAAEEPAPAGAASGDGQDTDLPAWLRDIEPATPAAAAGLPPWLAGDEAPEAPAVADQAPPGNELASGLDLPVWLRDTEPAAAGGAAVATAPVWLQGLEAEAERPQAAAAPEVTVAAPAAYAPVIERTPERLAAMQMLERLVVEPAAEPAIEPRTEVEQRPRSRNLTILQIAAFVLLLLAILVVLLGPPLVLGTGAAPAPAGAAQVSRRIDALAPGTPVLVAYEWDVRRASELRPLEDALFAQLTAKQLALMLMSTDPQGALLTRQRANRLEGGANAFYQTSGGGVVDLGFKPGGAFALARLAGGLGSLFEADGAGRDRTQDARILQTMCQSATGSIADCNLNRLGMIVVLADESEDARLWIEQVASAGSAVPMTFVTTAEVAPLVLPYMTGPGLSLLGGLPDAVTLQDLASQVSPRLRRIADAATVGAALLGILLLLGVIPAVWSGRRERRRRKVSVWER